MFEGKFGFRSMSYRVCYNWTCVPVVVDHYFVDLAEFKSVKFRRVTQICFTLLKGTGKLGR